MVSGSCACTSMTNPKSVGKFPLTSRQIHQGEIVAAQAHEQRPDDERHHEPREHAEQDTDIRIGAEVKQIERGGIGADREISRLPEGNKPDAPEEEAATHGVDREDHDLVDERQRQKYPRCREQAEREQYSPPPAECVHHASSALEWLEVAFTNI